MTAAGFGGAVSGEVIGGRCDCLRSNSGVAVDEPAPVRATRRGLFLMLMVLPTLLMLGPLPVFGQPSREVSQDRALSDMCEGAYEYSVQSASIIVLATVIKHKPSMMHVRVQEALRGAVRPGDVLRYRVFEEPMVGPGDRLLLFLRPRSGSGDFDLPLDPFHGRLLSDSRLRWVPLGGDTLAWSAVRSDIQRRLVGYLPDRLYVSADIAVVATITDGLRAAAAVPQSYAHAEIALHVTRSSDPALVPPDTTIHVQYPLPLGRPSPIWRYVAPILRMKDTGVFFLDRDPQGLFYFHGGLYSAWVFGGDSLSARFCDGRGHSPPLQVLASAPASRVLDMFPEAR